MTSRFEIIPLGRGEEEAAALPEPAHLTVTCSPRHGLDHTVDVAVRVRALGHRVTVHLTARMVRDRGHLDTLLGRMADAGIDDALVLGGDASPPHGPFSSAGELLRLVAGHPHRPTTIGIAGYPESHPLISDADLATALHEKARVADYVTTQLCFDPEAVLRFARSAPLPVVVGIPGLVERKRLLEISARVGVGPSLRYLRKQGGIRNLARLSRSSPDLLHGALAPHRDVITGFHFFTFNRLVDTWAWAQERCAAAGTSASAEATGPHE